MNLLRGCALRDEVSQYRTLSAILLPEQPRKFTRLPELPNWHVACSIGHGALYPAALPPGPSTPPSDALNVGERDVEHLSRLPPQAALVGTGRILAAPLPAIAQTSATFVANSADQEAEVQVLELSLAQTVELVLRHNLQVRIAALNPDLSEEQIRSEPGLSSTRCSSSTCRRHSTAPHSRRARLSAAPTCSPRNRSMADFSSTPTRPGDSAGPSAGRCRVP